MSPKGSSLRSVLSRGLLVLGSLIFGLALLELGAELWLRFLAPQQQFRHYASWETIRARAEREGRPAARYAPHRYVGFIPTPGFREKEERHDPLGFRGRSFPQHKPPGEFRIFCLGGSTTYTSMVADPKGRQLGEVV